MSSLVRTAAALAAGLTLGAAAQATVIGFNGGTATLNDNTTFNTTNNNLTQDVAKYEEQGFRVEFIFSGAPTSFSSEIGDYYGAGNAVIHGHWATGAYGNLTRIKFTKIDGSAFDLNYFVLTSNTDTGGGLASGNEKAYIHASSDGIADDYAQLLPPENWGFPASQIFLGSQFDAVKAFWFDVGNKVDCFGMDSFYINEAAPSVPEPGSMLLTALALLGLTAAGRGAKRG